MTDIINNECLIENEDTQKDRYLAFELDNESYGIEIKYITEIIGLQPITGVPELPRYICGIMNLRGKIIPVMDARLRFHKKFREYNDRTCVIIIEIMNMVTGLIVDSVEEVITIPCEDITVPSEVSIIENQYIKGIGKKDNKIILLLDCNNLLNVTL